MSDYKMTEETLRVSIQAPATGWYSIGDKRVFIKKGETGEIVGKASEIYGHAVRFTADSERKE